KIEITETILMNLRLLEGIDLKEFENRFGASIHSLYGCQLGDLTLNGLVEIKSGLLRLTEKGLYLGNIVFESFV
ncbi:MAG: coproporphyrinogen III oxidase, partial [Candidatus Margulisiibacteriota bacterium]